MQVAHTFIFYKTNKDVLMLDLESLFVNTVFTLTHFARSPRQVKLDLDKWKLWKDLFE